MSASVLVHWPNATEEEQQGHPGFFNDAHAWASWIVAVLGDESARRRLARLGLDALLSYTTQGADAEAVAWTTPDALESAARGLRRFVERGDPVVAALVELYEANAPGVDEAAVELARDLGDVGEIADYARRCGASKVTLGYYW